MYVYIMHKRTSRYNSSGREKTGGFPYRYWPSVHDQKTRIFLFLSCITPIPIYFHPIYFHSSRPHPRFCAYVLSASSLRVTFSRRKSRVRALVFPSRFSPFPLRRVSITHTHTNREPLTISKSLRFIVNFHFSYLPRAFSLSFFFFIHSRLFLSIFFLSLALFLSRAFLSELQNSTKCGNC